jgi:hypothetical protein
MAAPRPANFDGAWDCHRLRIYLNKYEDDGGGEDRTPDAGLMSPVLYQLSYPAIKGGTDKKPMSFYDFCVFCLALT